MKYIKAILIFISISTYGFSQDNIVIDSLIYPWLSPSNNFIQFYSKSSISNFYDALSNSKKNKVSVIHFGDSHIQSEIPTNETRNLLQKKYGNGGRGIVFPYSTAKTYSSIHYSSKHTGNWIYSKSTKLTKELPKGVMGISSMTTDSSASFTIIFNSKIPSNNLTFNLFCETDSLSYDVIVETDGNSTPVDVYKNSDNKGVVTFSVPSISNTITFHCLKTYRSQKQFILHGFEILNSENKGLVLYSSGVGGAKFNSLLNIENFNKQLKFISPDLVILDFGTNDFLYSDTIKKSLESEIKNVIASVRKSSPLISIILCTTQDLYYKQKNLNATEEYVKLIKKIAKETESAYWDWYTISGGKESLKTWLNQGLAKTDMIHLTNIGYRIKGKLLFEAIENTKNKLEKNQNLNELIVSHPPKKIEIVANNKSTADVISLSNRELVQNESKTKKDTLNLFNIDTESIKKDNIKTNQEVVKSNKVYIDTIKLKTNVSMNDTIVKIKNQTTNVNDTEKKIEKIIVTDKSASNTLINESKPKTSIDHVYTQPNLKNIKIELIEDLEDSTIINIENSKQLKESKNKKPSKKNYELAKERQNQILQHDTLAIKIIKDTIKPIVSIPKKTPKKFIKPKVMNYTVKSGDNLSFIAERYKISVAELKRFNGLKSDKLSIGQSLKIKK
jgi:lysophospholipase L1-like esterase/LysM repeat protein